MESDSVVFDSMDDVFFQNTHDEYFFIFNWVLEGTFFKTSRPYIASKFLQERCNSGKWRHYLFEYLDGIMLNLENADLKRIYYFLSALQEFDLFSLSYFLQYSIARKDLDKNTPEVFYI